MNRLEDAERQRQRFVIRRDTLSRPVLALFGATGSSRYVKLAHRVLRVRLGWLFDNTFAISDVTGVRERTWEWWRGVGWRTNFCGHVGLIGAYRGVVEVQLRNRG